MEQIALTPEGKKKLKEELDHRKDVLRPQIIKDIAEARAHGDLSENAEYHAAREEHSKNEGMISHIEAQIGSAIVIDITKKEPPEGEDRKVFFGCTVLLEEYTDDGDMLDEMEWKIVGIHEANLKEKKLSYKSPIGKSLIGKFEGDTVEVRVPTGTRIFEIIEVWYR